MSKYLVSLGYLQKEKKKKMSQVIFIIIIIMKCQPF